MNNFQKSRRLLVVASIALAGLHLRAELSQELTEALDQLHFNRPKDWAFTHTIATGEFHDVQEVEHYDPSQPLDEQWTVVTHKGHPATLQDNLDFRKKHTRKVYNKPSAPQPTVAPAKKAQLKITDVFKNFSDEIISETDSTTTHHLAGYFPHIEESRPPPFLLRGAVHSFEKKLEQTQVYADIEVNKSTKTVVAIHAWMPPFDKFIHEEVADIRLELATVDERIPPQIIKKSSRVKAHLLFSSVQINEVKQETYSDFKKVLKETSVQVGDDQLVDSDVLLPLTKAGRQN